VIEPAGSPVGEGYSGYVPNSIWAAGRGSFFCLKSILHRSFLGKMNVSSCEVVVKNRKK